MDFDYKLEKIHTDALILEYFHVPWDTEILEQPVAEIRHLEIKGPIQSETRNNDPVPDIQPRKRQ